VLASARSERLTEVGQRLRYELAERVDAESGLFVPLVYRGAAVGVLCAFDRIGGGEYTAEHERLLEGFAASAAIAVATAQRVAEQGLRRSIEASERERTRWARELHDETLQELAGLKVLLSSARGRDGDAAIATALEQIDISITGLRHLITELRPAALDEYGLAAAVEALIGRLRATSGLTIEADVTLAHEDATAETRLDSDMESTLYRLVQEGLTNAIRHADAETIHVTVSEGARHLHVEIRDDGRGIDPDAAGTGFGLVGMRERVALVGGTLEIRSAPGQGTSVSTRVPRRRPAA
jgi:signal transduction histidine kinase